MDKSINEAISELTWNKGLWTEVAPRGFKTTETINAQLYLEPRLTIFSTKTRPFNWKYFVGEFKWFLGKNANIAGISPEYSTFWLRLQNERGEVNSNYGKILLLDRGNQSQMKWVWESLKKDGHTRQAVAFISGYQYQTEGNMDFPCTIYMNFYIRDNKLNMIVRMRSNDICFGLTYDAPWFSLIQQNFVILLREFYPGLELGTYIHSADNLHYYERHYEEMKDLTPDKEYSFQLHTPFFNFDENGKTYITDEAKAFMDSIDPSMSAEEHKSKFSNLAEIITKFV